MDTEILSRIQFALTAGFHFLFPPVSIGFAVFLALVELAYLKTGDKKFLAAAKFFAKLFAMIFAVGVVTGIILVFQFGTNWPVYSKFVGDVFGSPLAIEAVFAFFMESTFLAVVLFGWDRVGRKAHFFATVMVCIGSHLSAVWIIAANSFMQTPDGYALVAEKQNAGGSKIVEELPKGYVPTPAEVANTRAQITDFCAMALNKSTLDRLSHTVAAAWLSGGFLALGVCSFYVLRRRRESEFAVPCGKIALAFSAVAAVAMYATGHHSASKLAVNQPEKLAAFEGHYETSERAPLYIFGIVDEKNKTVRGLKVDGFFSLLAFGDLSAEVKGLNELPSDEFIMKAESIKPSASAAAEAARARPKYWAPVQFCFQSFRIMVYLGCAIGALSAFGCLLWARGRLFDPDSKFSRLFMVCAMPSFALPLIASQAGWAAAEVGRQPWIVWHLLRTSDAVSTNASAGEILFSILLFTSLFAAVSSVFCAAFARKIRIGAGQ